MLPLSQCTTILVATLLSAPVLIQTAPIPDVDPFHTYEMPIDPSRYPKGILNKAERLIGGGVDSVADAAIGTANIVVHPINTGRATWQAVTHFPETSHAIKDNIVHAFKEDPYHATGYTLGTLAMVGAPLYDAHGQAFTRFGTEAKIAAAAEDAVNALQGVDGAAIAGALDKHYNALESAQGAMAQSSDKLGGHQILLEENAGKVGKAEAQIAAWEKAKAEAASQGHKAALTQKIAAARHDINVILKGEGVPEAEARVKALKDQFKKAGDSEKASLEKDLSAAEIELEAAQEKFTKKSEDNIRKLRDFENDFAEKKSKLEHLQSRLDVHHAEYDRFIAAKKLANAVPVGEANPVAPDVPRVSEAGYAAAIPEPARSHIVSEPGLPGTPESGAQPAARHVSESGANQPAQGSEIQPAKEPKEQPDTHVANEETKAPAPQRSWGQWWSSLWTEPDQEFLKKQKAAKDYHLSKQQLAKAEAKSERFDIMNNKEASFLDRNRAYLQGMAIDTVDTVKRVPQNVLDFVDARLEYPSIRNARPWLTKQGNELWTKNKKVLSVANIPTVPVVQQNHHNE